MTSPSILMRLTRVQFLPVILSPVLVGTMLAWWVDRTFSLVIFALTVLASLTFHLAANAIDDAYDFESGVDIVSNKMFPPDFGGWKPLPRGMMTFGQAKQVAYAFFLVTSGIGILLAYMRGPVVLILGAVGLFFAYYHVAPPLRLSYRGLGLSECGIFISFGILPVVGSYFVQAARVTASSLFLGIPLGLLTTCVLINHDQIFYEAYKQSGKKSFTVTVGRKAAMVTAAALTLISYVLLSASVAAHVAPWSALFTFLTFPLFGMQLRLYAKPAESPLHYVKLTQTTFALSVLFGTLLATALLIG